MVSVVPCFSTDETRNVSKKMLSCIGRCDGELSCMNTKSLAGLNTAALRQLQ